MTRPKKNPIKPCFSVPVRVSSDELKTELLRLVPEKLLAKAYLNASINAQQRMADNRHQRYRCQRFFRPFVERLTDPPDELLVSVGLKQPDPQQIPLPGIQVKEEPSAVKDTYEKALDRMKPASTKKEEPAPSNKAHDPWEDLNLEGNVIAYNDVKDVFKSYPYALDMTLEGHGRVLVLGYLSGWSRKSESLIRRNLVLNEVSFNKTVGLFKVIRHEEAGNTYHIKVVKYRPGAVIRSFTNVEGEGKGDLPDQHRYSVCTERGVEKLSQAAYNRAFEKSRQLRLVANS